MMDVIKNPTDEIYQKWKSKVEPVTGKNNCFYSMKTVKSTGSKYAKIFVMGNPLDTGDLEGDECTTNLTVQVDVYAGGAKPMTTAIKIDEASHEAMTNMGFRRIYGPEPWEDDGTKYHRLTSRYSRIYGGSLL